MVRVIFATGLVVEYAEAVRWSPGPPSGSAVAIEDSTGRPIAFVPAGADAILDLAGGKLPPQPRMERRREGSPYDLGNAPGFKHGGAIDAPPGPPRAPRPHGPPPVA